MCGVLKIRESDTADYDSSLTHSTDVPREGAEKVGAGTRSNGPIDVGQFIFLRIHFEGF